MITRFMRGQIWMYETDAKYEGRVFSGKHLGLILGVNAENTITVVPSTSKSNPEYKLLTSIDLELTNLDGVKTVGHFIPNMIQTIDTRKLCRYVGTLDEPSIVAVQTAVGRYLGFDKICFNQKEDSIPIKPVEKVINVEPVLEEQKSTTKKQKENDICGIDYIISRGKRYDAKVKGMVLFGKPISNWPSDILDSILHEYVYDPKVSITGLAFEYGVSDTALGVYLRAHAAEYKERVKK